MAKSLNQRMTDTLAYLQSKLTQSQYREVTQLLTARGVNDVALGNNDDIATDMSLGNTT
ncbi:MAG: hypothetical protein H7Z19_08410 [Chitinophagaceae bacterium]|nr:hypothetical protein [Rubrivivax sp.]